MDKCPSCGGEINSGTECCDACTTKNESTNTTRGASKWYTRKTFLVVLIAVFITMSVAGAMIMFQKPSTPPLPLLPEKDIHNPIITITSPFDQEEVTASTIIVTGTASDDVAIRKVEVKVGSGSYQLASGTASWSIPVALKEGSNTITARATDTSGNFHVKSITITAPASSPHSNDDPINPMIDITSPEDGTTVTTSTIKVTGTASDNIALSKIEIKVDEGNYHTAKGTTSWSISVTLAEGENTIYARATDDSGNFAIVAVIVNFSSSAGSDTTNPMVAITSHSTGEVVTTSSITVSGTASDTSLDRVEVKVGQGSYHQTSGTTSWSISVTLVEGENTISAKATDDSGNFAIVAVIVNFSSSAGSDTTNPMVAITSHSTGDVVTTSSITVSGTASDNSLDRVEVKVGQGSYHQASGTTSWSISVTLAEGRNTITARATDNSGNNATVSVTINLTLTSVSLPASPNNLRVKATSPQVIKLEWTDNSNNEKGFEIERRPLSGAMIYDKVGTTTNSWYLDQYDNTKSYYKYRVRAFNDKGSSSWSKEEYALPVLRVINDLQDGIYPDGRGGQIDVGIFNTILWLRVGPTNPPGPDYERLSKSDYSCNYGDYYNLLGIDANYRSDTSYMDVEVSNYAPSYYVLIQCGWWDVDPFSDIDSKCFVRHPTKMDNGQYKAVTIQVSNHYCNYFIIRAHEYLPDFTSWN